MTGLIRRGARYAIRRVIPKDLQEHFGRREIVRTLGTADLREAKRLHHESWLAIERLFDQARDQLAGLAVPDPKPQTQPHTMSDAEFAYTMEQLAFQDQQAAEDDAAEERMAALEQRLFDPKADLGANELAARDLINHERWKAQLDRERQAYAKAEPLPDKRPKKGHSFAEVVKAWAADRKPGAKAVRRVEQIVEEFEGLHGKVAIEAVTKQQIAKFKDKLVKEGRTPAIVRHLADIAEQTAKSGGYYPFGSMLDHHWSPKPDGWGHIMSAPSLTRLQALWACEDEGVRVRVAAMQLWRAAARQPDLTALRHIALEDDLGSEAIVTRVKFRDPTIVSVFGQRIAEAERTSWWWQFARGGWMPELAPVVEDHLNRRRQLKAEAGRFLDADYMIAEALMWMDRPALEALLERHWDHLASDAIWVQLALFAATARTRTLARIAIDGAKDPRALLQHLSMHFGLKSIGQPSVTLHQLASLEPYLELLSPLCLSSLIEAANDRGCRDWRRRHLDPLLSENEGPLASQRPSYAAKLDELAASQDPNGHIHFWVRSLRKSEGDLDGLALALGDWVVAGACIRATKIGAAVAIEMADRIALTLLDRWRGLCGPEGDAILDDAGFALKRASLR